jgi:hypothetical protein
MLAKRRGKGSYKRQQHYSRAHRACPLLARELITREGWEFIEAHPRRSMGIGRGEWAIRRPPGMSYREGHHAVGELYRLVCVHGKAYDEAIEHARRWHEEHGKSQCQCSTCRRRRGELGRAPRLAGRRRRR